MARPKRGGGSSNSGGGGGGFLQGLFGPQANAGIPVMSPEAGDMPFDQPIEADYTPTQIGLKAPDQPYQTPTGWQRFFAPEQSRATEAANVNALQNNALLTKDQAFRTAQELAREKANQELQKQQLAGSLNNRLTELGEIQRFTSEQAVQQEESARRQAEFAQNLVTKELLRNQAAQGQAFRDAGISNTNIAGLEGLGGAKYTPEMLVRLALAEKLKGGEAMQQGGTVIEPSRREAGISTNLLTKALADQKFPFAPQNARSEMLFNQGHARQANMLFNPALEFSDTGSVLRSLVPPSVETDIVEGPPRKFGDITLPGLPTKVRTVHPGQVDGAVVGVPSKSAVFGRTPVGKVDLTGKGAPAPVDSAEVAKAAARTLLTKQREELQRNNIGIGTQLKTLVEDTPVIGLESGDTRPGYELGMLGALLNAKKKAGQGLSNQSNLISDFWRNAKQDYFLTK